MDEARIQTLEDIVVFLTDQLAMPLELQGNKDEVYSWTERTLVRFRYLWLSKKKKGLVRRYIERLTGLSHSQLTRLIKQYSKTGRIRRRQRTAKGFESKYTKADICLLADVDRVVDDLSGTAVKVFLPAGA